MKVTRIIMIALLVALIVGGGWWHFSGSKPVVIRFPAGSSSGNPSTFSYEPYAVALGTHVNGQGMVNYRGLKANRDHLDAFAASLSGVKQEEFDSWSDRQKIAFWINAYNALTLEAILRNYPIPSSLLRSVVYPKNSIRQIPGVWDKLGFVVVGQEMTLNDIEHGTLRARFHEPRIHVALVCAAMSCPPLRNEPYTAEKLDEQLDDQARAFLRSPRALRIDRDGGTVYLSSIFKWFGDDFIPGYGASEKFAGKSDAERAVLNFASQYADQPDREFLLGGRYKVAYLDYDWSLNEQSTDSRSRAGGMSHEQ